MLSSWHCLHNHSTDTLAIVVWIGKDNNPTQLVQFLNHAHGTRPQSLWKVSGALWAGMGAALLSAGLLLAASPATAADKAGAKAAPIKAHLPAGKHPIRSHRRPTTGCKHR